MKTPTQAASERGCSPTYIRKLAADGRIPGAIKLSPRVWLLPVDWTVTTVTRGRPKK